MNALTPPSWFAVLGIWTLLSLGFASNAHSSTVEPALLTPTNNALYSASSQAFTWAANGADTSAYALTIGSTAGASDVYDSGALGAKTLSHTVTNLGTTALLHIRFWFRSADGLWAYKPSILASSLPPSIHLPKAQSTLSGNTETFSWNSNGVQVKRYWLYIGGSPGGREYTNQDLGIAESYTASNLPTDGSTLWLRLWYFSSNNRWQYQDYEYQAFGGGLSQQTPNYPEIIEPKQGSVLTRNEVTIKWGHNNYTPEKYWVYIGTSEGSYNIHSSGNLGTVNEYTYGNMPLSLNILYIRLWYYAPTHGWQSNDYQYSSKLYNDPQITLPQPGSKIESTNPAFTWSTRNQNARKYQLLIGRKQGDDDMYNSGALSGSTFSHTAHNIQLNVPRLYVTLRFQVAGIWHEEHYRYTTPVYGFNDNFNAGLNHWTEIQGQWFSSDSKYLSTEVGDNWAMVSYTEDEFSDLDYRVKVRRSDNEDQPIFLNIRDSGEKITSDCWCAGDSCYTFEITPLQNFAVWSCKGSDWFPLKTASHSDLINPGDAWNEMRAVAEGDALSFFINGELTWQGNDSSHTSGSVGIGLVNFEENTPSRFDVDWAKLSVQNSSRRSASPATIKPNVHSGVLLPRRRSSYQQTAP